MVITPARPVGDHTPYDGRKFSVLEVKTIPKLRVKCRGMKEREIDISVVEV